jgi:hypothetical protein
LRLAKGSLAKGKSKGRANLHGTLRMGVFAGRARGERNLSGKMLPVRGKEAAKRRQSFAKG